MLKTAAVSDLLGEFDHEIQLEDDWQFAIAYGLNGVGKTKFLELINATMNVDLDRLMYARFTSLRLLSDNGDILKVTKYAEEDELDLAKIDLIFQLTRADTRDVVEWAAPMEADMALRRRILRNTTFVPMNGSPALWQDQEDGEIVDFAQLRGRFGPHRQAPSDRNAQMPRELKDFLDNNHTYLIETQRLVVMPSHNARMSSERQSSPQWNVDGYAGDLRQRIERSLASNSLASQRLDRSFPRRIIEQSLKQAMSEDAIRQMYMDQDKHRNRLVDIGLTSAEIDVPLPDKELVDWQRAVLTTYLEDNAAKLGTFDDLLARISLLEELINARFLRKRIVVNKADGLALLSTTSGTAIPVSGLSTGEQHELVLLYNLLFRVEKGTLVLIDEPEISLHVTWQKNFIDDVLRVAELSEFKFIVATHAPGIIGNWWSRTVKLGPSEDA